jgi:hypothetical protein
VPPDRGLQRDSLGDLWLLRLEIAEGRKVENDESRRCEEGHAAPDLELGKESGGEKV